MPETETIVTAPTPADLSVAGNIPTPTEEFQRYQLDTGEAPNLAKFPPKFKVKVKRYQLAKFLAHELLEKRGTPHFKEVVTSRPCVYGTFGGRVGGFNPIPEKCVGCLRCVTEHPDMCVVTPNPDLAHWGDSFLKPSLVETINHEASTGAVPVKGQGYRGRMGGPGWDGMWTDMSEIVRPTRDGIHGRETISTVVDIGRHPEFVALNEKGKPIGQPAPRVALPLPILFDTLPLQLHRSKLPGVLAKAAQRSQTLSIQPIRLLLDLDLAGNHLVPLVRPQEEGLLKHLSQPPLMVELEGKDRELYDKVSGQLPSSIICHRLTFNPDLNERLVEMAKMGCGVFHLVADYHGRDANGNFVLDLIREAHGALVEAGLRDQVTLIGSGGMVAAEHIPKAIICGLDVVALNTPLYAALNFKPVGDVVDPEMSHFQIPRFKPDWGEQRLVNLLASWRDQLLEIMGAMGLREVRRLRGEIGRAMFQAELEQEAFGGIDGYA